MQHCGDGFVQIAESPRAQAAKLSLRDARRVKEEFMLHADERQLLQLPLVHFDGRLANFVEKILEIR